MFRLLKTPRTRVIAVMMVMMMMPAQIHSTKTLSKMRIAVKTMPTANPRDSNPSSRYVFLLSSSFNAAELMQNRKPAGFGPSGNTCPRCASQRRHMTSVRSIP